jgi:hypothetical protein
MNNLQYSFATLLNKSLLLMTFSLTLVSCSMLPDSLSFSDVNLTQDAKERSSSKAQKDNTTQLTAELQSAVKEWEYLKPSITRLVNLETDLEYLLVQLSDANSTPMLEQAPVESFAPEPVESFAAEEAPTVDLASASPIMELKQNPSFAAVTNKQARNQLAGRPASDISRSVRNVTMDKFSGSQKASLSLAPKMTNIDDSKSNKFSGQMQTVASMQGLSLYVDDGNKCLRASSKTVVSNGIAIHLASFKSEQLAEETLNNFDTKYKDITCNKNPIIKEVIVKNVTYHSARLGPYNNRNAAEEACRAVRTVQSYCAVTQYEGVVL